TLPKGTRAGTADRPGREYFMAKMATDVLDRDDLDVLVFGAGRSLDNRHIERLPRVRSVAIGDIMKLRDDADFVDLNQPGSRRFPVVIASEVIEHFRQPRDDFATLFSFVERDGLIVCGTNIYAGGDLSSDRYLFYPDHTSYFTPSALMRIAGDAGFHIDFRAPKVGTAMRKRYVLFSRSRSVLDSVGCYFGAHVYAPSEHRSAPQKTKQRGPDGQTSNHSA
ncbi:MAG: methyltransferase domain-containing protein, partial [Nocardioidaceae bacterium]